MSGKFLNKTIVMIGAAIITVIFVIGAYITVTHINKADIPQGLTETQIIEIASEALPNKTPEEIDKILNSTLTEEQQEVAEQTIEENFNFEQTEEIDLDTLTTEGAITEEEADRIEAGMDPESATHTEEEAQQSIADMMKQMEEEMKRLQEEINKQQEQEDQGEQGDQTPSDQENTGSEGTNNSDNSSSDNMGENQTGDNNSNNSGSTSNDESEVIPPPLAGQAPEGDLGGDDSFEDNKGGSSDTGSPSDDCQIRG